MARSVDRGELPPATDIELFADVAPALARYRRQITGEHLDEEFIDRMADQFFPPAISPAYHGGHRQRKAGRHSEEEAGFDLAREIGPRDRRSG